MDINELNSWIKSEEGASWLNEQKTPLINKRNELLNEVKQLGGNLTTANQRAADSEKLLKAERAAIRKLAIDDQLDRELDRLRIMPTHKASIAAHLRANNEFSVVADGDNRMPMVGDKPLSSFMDEWSASPEAKASVEAAVNDGGGSLGSGESGGPGFTLERIKSMSTREVADSWDNPEFQRALKGF